MRELLRTARRGVRCESSSHQSLYIFWSPVQVPTGPRPRDVGINERLIGAVQSLSYASFADRESSASNGEDEEQGESTLAQWQLQHAQLILKECPELESLRFALCPKCATLSTAACATAVGAAISS